jgi:hypothetical protein
LIVNSNFDLHNIPNEDDLSIARFSGLSVGANAFYGIPLKCTTVIRTRSPHGDDQELELKKFLEQRTGVLRKYDPKKTYTDGWLNGVDDPNYSGAVSSNAFRENFSLEAVRLPKARTIGMSAFEECLLLNLVDISGAEFLFSGAFSCCYALKELCLRHDVTWKRPNVAIFSNEPFASCVEIAILKLAIEASSDVEYKNLISAAQIRIRQDGEDLLHVITQTAGPIRCEFFRVDRISPPILRVVLPTPVTAIELFGRFMSDPTSEERKDPDAD